MVNLRFLDAALNRLDLTAYTGSFATDGYRIYYDPKHVLRIYRTEQNTVCRDILHMIFHCVFRHICIPEDADIRIWNLACDIACEYTVSGLNLKAASCRREQRQMKIYPELEASAGMLTAEKIYRYYVKCRPDEERLTFLEETFSADDHGKWLRSSLLESVWSSVSRRMQIDMETFARQQGSRAGAVMLNLREVNREVSDYAGFLRKFATKGDGMKLDPDEFDYTLYSLGMQMSGGRMPMIEPVEYKDSMRIRDIVLAVYTSSAMPVWKVRLFLIQTWDILHSTETFASKVRLHILYTPAKLDQQASGGWMQHVVITGTEEMAEFARDFEPAPSDEPDFRTAFNQVRSFKKQREFKNLRGLMVLTDREGIFPAGMPQFSGAFIFVNDDYSTPSVPAWAIRLVLQKDDLK